YPGQYPHRNRKCSGSGISGNAAPRSGYENAAPAPAFQTHTQQWRHGPAAANTTALPTTSSSLFSGRGGIDHRQETVAPDAFIDIAGTTQHYLPLRVDQVGFRCAVHTQVEPVFS